MVLLIRGQENCYFMHFYVFSPLLKTVWNAKSLFGYEFLRLYSPKNILKKGFIHKLRHACLYVNIWWDCDVIIDPWFISTLGCFLKVCFAIRTERNHSDSDFVKWFEHKYVDSKTDFCNIMQVFLPIQN